MEEIRDMDRKMLCTADRRRGIIEHVSRKDRIRIFLPVGGEVRFEKGRTCTVVRRDGSATIKVYRRRREEPG